ncbi:MAG: HupE/UreJ family protein [Polymorphobacter sp.]
MSMWRLSAVLLLALAMLCGTTARADVFNLGEYSFLPGEAPGLYELVVSIPEAVTSPKPVTWPQGCTQISEDRQSQAGRARLSFTIRCDRDLVRSDTITTPWPVDGAAFTTSALGEQVASQLQAGDSGVVLPIGATEITARPLATVATDFMTQGFLHILGGWDHLAFVLCLCMLARGRTLLWLVTVFTIGHSLSLALAFFEIVQVPVPPVEAVIALSIAFMAREALLSKDSEDRAARTRHMVVVGGFGLLHGLGFATVLGEIGVTHDERVPGLIFFNLGVEAGQLAFVTGVLGLGALAQRFGQAQPFRLAALYSAGIIGTFWLFERVAGFGAAAA